MTSTLHAETIDALCRAIDAGDDALLPILADALEDAGDARAAGLRRIAFSNRRPAKQRHCGIWLWKYEARSRGRRLCRINASEAARMPPRWSGCSMDGYSTHGYQSRSTAYLALALALTESDR